VYTNNANVCNDGSLCTSGDVCVNGSCAGIPIACGDADACNGVDACDPFTGTCSAGPALDCNDGDACTTDSCDSIAGCLHSPPGGFVGPDCYLDQLAAMIGGAPNGSIRGRRLPVKLVTLLTRARDSVVRASATSGNQRSSHLRRAGKKLAKFNKTFARAEQHGKVDPGLADSVELLSGRVQGLLLGLASS
jgi:hypothetical protein